MVRTEESAVGHGTRSAWFTLREGSAVAMRNAGGFEK
jgi:hypothetical protein